MIVCFVDTVFCVYVRAGYSHTSSIKHVVVNNGTYLQLTVQCPKLYESLKQESMRYLFVQSQIYIYCTMYIWSQILFGATDFGLLLLPLHGIINM